MSGPKELHANMSAQALPAYPPMIGLRGDPIPIPAEFSHNLAALIIEWSRVEQTLLTDLEALCYLPGMDKVVPQVPFQFDPMLKAWIKAVRHLFGSIEAYQIVAEHIYKSGGDLSPKRNHLIHGLWAIEGPDLNDVWTVRNMKRVKGGGYQLHRSEVDIERLTGTVAAVRKLSEDIIGFTTSRMLHMHKGLLKFERRPSQPSSQTPD